MFGILAAVAERCVARSKTLTWPSPKYAKNPVAFARDILGVNLWSRQVEVLNAIRDNRNVSVRSGHKVGKSTVVAVAALWFFCTFPGARVVLTAVKSSQIDQIVWREVRRLHRESKYPIGGEIHELSRSGLRDPSDDRQIIGFTARDGEGLAGMSGANVMVLADEASGIHDRFFETLGSSLAGSGGTVRKVYISNPTRSTGEFYRSHTSNKSVFKCIAISSEETPNARGLDPVPGLAGPEWIAEKKIEYGEDSPTYAVRVKGEFTTSRDGKIISAEVVEMGESAYDLVPAVGQLQLGIDPAGDGVLGDETAIAGRRGAKILGLRTYRGLSEEAVVEAAIDYLNSIREERETLLPRIAVDAEGGIGARTLGHLRAHLDKHPGAYEIVVVRSGRKMWGSPEFDLIRDALWGHFERWLSAGGAIPTDAKLSEELRCPTFALDLKNRYVATPKKEMRKLLGRSPDRADACLLAAWGYESDGSESDMPDATDEPNGAAESPRGFEDDSIGAGGSMDPYAGANWGGV